MIRLCLLLCSPCLAPIPKEPPPDQHVIGFFGIRMTSGNEKAKIDEVIENSPAKKAGLKPGDVIEKVGDAAIESEDELRGIIAQLRPGSTFPLTVLRDKKSILLSIKVRCRTPDDQ